MTSTVKKPFGVFQKALIVTGTAGAFAAALFLVHVSGDTQIAMTLSPPTLEDGLVGHWTFDGKDMPSGQVNDVSGQGNHGSMASMATSTAYTEGVLGQSLNFDGVDDLINVGSATELDDLGPVTISAWIKPRSSGESNLGRIVEKSAGTGSWGFYLDASSLEFGKDGSTDVWRTSADKVTLHAWQHVAATWDGTTQFSGIRLFLNGVEMSYSIGQNGSGLSTDEALDMCIGSVCDGTGSYDGIIDGVRVYNRVLSLDEIKHLYQLGATSVIATTPEPPPLSGAAGGLVGHWTFNGKDMPQGQVNDRSGQGNHGSMVSMSSSTAYVAGVLGQALKFDGSDDVITAGSATVLDDLGPMTVSAWIKPDSFGEGNVGQIVTKSSGSGSWFFSLDTSRLRFDKAGSASLIRISSAGAIQLGIWQHVLMTWDGSDPTSSVQIYVNNTKLTSWAFEQNGSGLASDEARDLLIGNRGENDRTFDGAIDDVRVYNRVLSLDEIKHLYQLGATTKVATTPEPPPLSGAAGGLVGHWTFDGKDMPSGQVNDRSGQGNHGSMVSMSSSTAYVAGVLGQALKFDGVDDRIEIAQSAALNEGDTVTVGFWVRAKASEQPDSFTRTVSKRTSGVGWEFQRRGTTQDITLRIDTNEVSNSAHTWFNVPVFDGEWHHLMFVIDQGSVRGYIDGIQGNLTGGTYAHGTGFGNTESLHIGRHVAGGLHLNGSLDDVRVYNRALSLDEIKQLYQMGQ